MGQFASKLWVKVLAWIAAAIIVGLNARLVVDTIGGWIESSGPDAWWLWVTVVPIAAGCAILLLYVALPKRWRPFRAKKPAAAPAIEIATQTYTRIGVALDYGPTDNSVLSHAQTMARQHGATMVLFHVVEGVSGQVFGGEAYDGEAREDKERIEEIAARLRAAGVEAIPALGFGPVPDALVRLSNEHKIDILVMGGHGHRGIKDIFYGASISEVRHRLAIPVLVVQQS